MKEGEFANEMNSLKVLNHPGIISFFGLAKINESTCLVMELCVPDLRELQHCPGRRLTEEEIGILVGQILDAAAYVHQHGVIHR